MKIQSDIYEWQRTFTAMQNIKIIHLYSQQKSHSTVQIIKNKQQT